MRLVSIKIVAEFLMIKQSTLYSWVHKGSIPFHKLNGLVRFDLDEIEAWVKSSKKQASSNDIRIKKEPMRDIDDVVRKAIDGVKGNRYNPSNGKPGLHQGLRKED
jgi:excisionase family DNA binding protein